MLKAIAKSLAKKLDHQILGLPRAYADERTLAGLLQYKKINLVLDVGANQGQFATYVRSLGYAGRIHSFEPLSVAHQHLLKLAHKDPEWIVAPRMAIGSISDEVEIHVAGNSVSSSILPMLQTHAEAEPGSAYIGVERVQLNRLDDVIELTPEDRVLLKIDVQGLEHTVFDGAQRILPKCSAVIVEMSVVPLYEGQSLAKQLWDFLVDAGFEVWSVEPGGRDAKTGRMLQFDGLFVHS